MTDQLRASDGERQEVGALLSRHFTDGRLDRDELDERLGAAMRATTRGELAALLFDLPALESAPPPVLPQRRSRRLAALALALPLLAVPLSLAARGHASHVAPAVPAHLLPVHLRLLPGGHTWRIVRPDGPYGGALVPAPPTPPASAPSLPSTG